MIKGGDTAIDGRCVPYRFPHRPCDDCAPTCNNVAPGPYGGWDAYENVVALGAMRVVIADLKAEIGRLRWANIERNRLDNQAKA